MAPGSVVTDPRKRQLEKFIPILRQQKDEPCVIKEKIPHRKELFLQSEICLYGQIFSFV